MQAKAFVIGIVEKDGRVLLRKKPDGSPPYTETWYLFGGETNADASDAEPVLIKAFKDQAGIRVRPLKRIGWDLEIKPDLERIETLFVYLDYQCEYSAGKLVKGKGIEKLEWVPISKLAAYDLVPPTRKLFQKLGYLK